MTLQEIIKTLHSIALTQPNIRSVGEGDIYDTLNAEASSKYAYFFITQNKHQQTEDTDRYSLNVFYIDRLEDDKENKLQIQSTGKEVLTNIFNTFCDDFDAEMSGVDFQTFTERFSDMCAGVYATVAFEVVRDTNCAEYYNVRYEPNIPIKIINQTKIARYTLNGRYEVSYDEGFTGLDKVDVDVDIDTDSFYNSGYDEGYSQGSTEGYGQGYANGYSQGESDGITTGVSTGREQVYNEAQELYITENGVYESDVLYKRVEVDVQGGGGDCNIGNTEIEMTETVQTFYASDYGYNGFDFLTVNGANLYGDVLRSGNAEILDSLGAGDGTSAELPYTTPQVFGYAYRCLMDAANKTSGDVYVKGIVLRVDEIKNNKAGTFSIGFNNEGENKYEINVYNCRYIDQGTFPNDGIKVGDNVVLKCRVRTLNYQLYGLQGGTLISVETPEEGGGNCQELIDNAMVLDITENGTYYTQYAELPEWNEPETGDDFYSYAILENNTYFNTGYVGNEQSVVEFWFKYDDSINMGLMGTIVGKQGSGGTDIMKLRANNYTSGVFIVERKDVAQSGNIKITKDVWHKIKLSYEGLWVDNERVLTYTSVPEWNDNVPFCINGTTGWEYGGNGYYGMVKIDDNVYIPTATGFINRNTGEPLEVKGTNYTFVGMEQPVPLENLIKQVNVNVENKIDIAALGIKFGNSKFIEVPAVFDFGNVDDFSHMFNSCSKLKKAPAIDTSNATTAENMFYYAAINDESYDVLSTYRFPKCLKFTNVLGYTYVTDLGFISDWGYPLNADWGQAFSNAQIKKCPAIYMEGSSDYYEGYPFWGYSDLTNFTDFGGFIGLKYSLTKGGYQFGHCPNFTYESWKNVLNGLYDFVGNGVTPASNQGKIQLHSKAYNLLTEDDIAEATAKGWTLS